MKTSGYNFGKSIFKLGIKKDKWLLSKMKTELMIQRLSITKNHPKGTIK